MLLSADNFTKEEVVTLSLRRLFARYGYSRYRMGKFEAYDIYREHKSFLKSGGIITFTDGSGKLMALKPDVTMSVVKNVPADAASRKLYYSENVFRMNPHEREYREISQMGVEYIGGSGVYAEAEVVWLALQSLAVIGDDYVLNISHMGYVASLLDALGLQNDARSEALRALGGKNAHALQAVAQQGGLAAAQQAQLCALAGLSGEFTATLAAARQLCVTDEMRAACDELEKLYNALCAVQTPDLRLNFSMVNDVDYYNGIIFQGFVRGVPRAVLSGGRYDNLLRRFGKPQPALGFALYLGELSRALAAQEAYDVDSLLLYSPSQSAALVAKAVQSLAQRGSVRAEMQMPDACRAAAIYRLDDDGTIREEAQC